MPLKISMSLYLFVAVIATHGDLGEMFFWNQIQYLALPFIPILWLIVAFLYTKTVYTFKRGALALLMFIPASTFILRLTNPWHHLFYTGWDIEANLRGRIQSCRVGCELHGWDKCCGDGVSGA